jgi:hypothetical protein
MHLSTHIEPGILSCVLKKIVQQNTANSIHPAAVLQRFPAFHLQIGMFFAIR